MEVGAGNSRRNETGRVWGQRGGLFRMYFSIGERATVASGVDVISRNSIASSQSIHCDVQCHHDWYVPVVLILWFAILKVVNSLLTYDTWIFRSALEKGMQWERALGLFEEMKMDNLPITVVSYGSAISACDKGFQYRQCLEYLDEMSDVGISKNVIIFGAAMSCCGTLHL